MLAATEFVIGPYMTSLDDGEIIEAIVVPRRPNTERWGHYKMARKTGEYAESMAIALIDKSLGTARLVVGAAFGFGIAEGVLALMPNYAWFAVACIPVGFASLTMMTAANTAIQMTTEPTMRGRVMALYMIVFLGATPVGAPNSRLP